MLVSVIIPHYNDLANLDVCLNLLERQTLDQTQYEVIVADNNSACGLAAVETLAGKRAKVIAATEQGAGPARNAGASHAQGNILAFIDSDCVPAETWLANGAEALSHADFIGGRVDVLSKEAGKLTPAEAFETVFAFNFEDYVRRKNFTGSGNMFVRRDVFERVGGFKATVSEDMEWSHRAIAQGFRLAYADNVVVGHPARRTMQELCGKWRRLVEEGYAYHRSRGGGALKWFIQAIVVAASPLVHVPKVLGSRKLSRLEHRLGAVLVLFAIRFYRAIRMIRVLL